MKNFKKVIAFALAAIMMMAMSVTAFAAPATQGATIRVTNISARDEKTVLTVYQLASIDTAKNEVVVADWAKAAYNKDLKPNFDAGKLNEAFAKANPAPAVVKTAESVKGANVEFTDLEAGVYMIKAVGEKVQYSTMVAVAYKADDKGNYVSETEVVEIKAKGSSNNMDKVEDDGLARTGQKVNFELTSTVPYMANKTENVQYKVYDKQTNLSKPENVKVFVGGEEMSFSFNDGEAKGDSTLYTMDLTSLVVSGKNDMYAGKTVVVKYTATVLGSNGFVNQTYDSTYDLEDNGEPKNPPTVKGWPADITLVKYAEDGKTVLKGAEFEVSKNGTVLNFTKEAEGVYVYSETAVEGTTTTTIAAPEGTVQIKGLDEGTYHFAETKAPEGYTINPAGVDVVIQDLSQQLKNRDDELTEAEAKALSQKAKMLDSKLSSLPFTGGMGTTLFTVLGVALMALASALYFATKRKAAAN